MGVSYAVTVSTTPANAPNVATVTIAPDVVLAGYVPPMPDGVRAKVTVDKPATGPTVIRIEAAP